MHGDGEWGLGWIGKWKVETETGKWKNLDIIFNDKMPIKIKSKNFVKGVLTAYA